MLMFSKLTPLLVEPFELIKLDTVESTSQFLKDKLVVAKERSYLLCVTNKQTTGYGQQGRSWASNEDSLTFSFGLPIDDIASMGPLSALVALELSECVARHSSSRVALKWPNDLWVNNQKAAGILVEIQKSHQTNQYHCVIGIGINQRPVCNSSQQFSGFVEELNIVEFFADLSEKIIELSERLSRKNLRLNVDEWQKKDFFSLDETITVYDGDSIYEGLYKGLTPEGRVLIGVDSSIKRFFSGRVSIRKTKQRC